MAELPVFNKPGILLNEKAYLDIDLDLDLEKFYGSLFGSQALYLSNYICYKINELYKEKDTIRILEFGYGIKDKESDILFYDILLDNIYKRFPEKKIEYYGMERNTDCKLDNLLINQKEFLFNNKKGFFEKLDMKIIKSDRHKYKDIYNNFIFDIFICIAPNHHILPGFERENINKLFSLSNNIESFYQSYNIFKELKNKHLKNPDIISYLTINNNFDCFYFFLLLSLLINENTLFFEIYNTEIEMKKINKTIEQINSEEIYNNEYAYENYNLPFRNELWNNLKFQYLELIDKSKYLKYKSKYLRLKNKID